MKTQPTEPRTNQHLIKDQGGERRTERMMMRVTPTIKAMVERVTEAHNEATGSNASMTDLTNEALWKYFTALEKRLQK